MRWGQQLGQQRGNKEDTLVLAMEATSTFKLTSGNDNSVVMDGTLLEDVVVKIRAGAMDGDSPVVGTFDNNDDNAICCCHPAGPLFWV